MKQKGIAIAVAYMRPFTGQAPGRLPDEYVPNGEPDARYHAELKDLRHKVYAHTDQASGRSTSVRAATKEGDVVTVEWREDFRPLERDALPSLVDFFERLSERYRSEAASIHVQLHGLGTVGDS